MTTVRGFLSERFEEFKREGERSTFAGQALSMCDKDELLAVIGWNGREQEARRKDREHADAVLDEFRAARRSRW